MMRSQKGSLNLSIQAIVIVVIAFVVLGLGLTFVQDTFDDIGGTTQDIQATIKEQVLKDLRESGEKLSVTQEVMLERGKQTVEGIGIANQEVAQKKFGIQIVAIKKQDPEAGETPAGEGGFDDEIKFFYNKLVEKKLSATEGDVVPVTITATSSASGVYLYKVNVLMEVADGGCAGDTPVISDGCIVYDTNSFFVRVS